jgi:hypothetical protein
MEPAFSFQHLADEFDSELIECEIEAAKVLSLCDLQEDAFFASHLRRLWERPGEKPWDMMSVG